MKVKFLTTALVISITSLSSFAEEGKTTTMADCTKIADSQQRLACFDRLSKEAEQNKNVEGFEIIDLPKPSRTQTKQKQEDPDAEFGMDKVKTNDEKMVTSIKGKFTGWTGDTKFEFANGQVWRQVSMGTYHISVTNPTIIIERGFMGAYYMQVKGYNKRITVKRVK